MSKLQQKQQFVQQRTNKKFFVCLAIVSTLVIMSACVFLVISILINNGEDKELTNSDASTSAISAVQVAYRGCSDLIDKTNHITTASEFDGVYFSLAKENEWLICMIEKLDISRDILEYDDIINFGQESVNDVTIIVTRALSLTEKNLEGVIFSNTSNRLTVAYEGCGNLYFVPDSIKLQDDAMSLSITSGNNSWGKWMYGLSCVHAVVEMPKRLSSMLEGNSIFYDVDSDSWGNYSVRWNIENYILKSETIYRK